MTIDNLIEGMRGHRLYAGFIKTSLVYGFFTNGKLVTKMTKEELAKLQKQFQEDLIIKQADPLDLDKLMQKTGSILEASPPRNSTVELRTPSGKRYAVWAANYRFLCDRHPSAQWYTSFREDMVIASEKSTVALLMTRE